MKHRTDYAAAVTAMLMIAFAVSNGGAYGIAGQGGSDTVLIVPARPAVLQLAFDLENMRDITIVSFRTQASATHRGKATQVKATSSEPLIHVWTGKDWQFVSFGDFCSARFLGRAPKTAIIIGDDQALPKTLLQGMAWPCRIERLPSMNAAELINGLDPYFNFSSREWKRLADSYGLKLEDVNASKREFNPYNIPRSKMPLETHEFKQEKDDTPPAVLIEKPGAQTGNKDNK